MICCSEKEDMWSLGFLKLSLTLSHWTHPHLHNFKSLHVLYVSSLILIPTFCNLVFSKGDGWQLSPSPLSMACWLGLKGASNQHIWMGLGLGNLYCISHTISLSSACPLMSVLEVSISLLLIKSLLTRTVAASASWGETDSRWLSPHSARPWWKTKIGINEIRAKHTPATIQGKKLH